MTAGSRRGRRGRSRKTSQKQGERGLAGAVRPYDAHPFALIDAQIETV